jgi:hypothetical protein
MNYQRLYQYLVKSKQQLTRVKLAGDGMETHHILPRCLGGDNSKSNLVLLTPKEHYVAHHLLMKMHTGKDRAKMAYALLKMCKNNPNQQRITTARQFHNARLAVMLYCSGELSPSYGRRHSTASKQQMSMQRQGVLNPAYGQVPWNKGLCKITSSILGDVSEQAKLRIKQRGHPSTGRQLTQRQKDHIGNIHRGKPKSEEHKQKLSICNTGKVLTIETRQKMSDTRRGKPKPTLTCPHCNKVGMGPAMNRWHFAKCTMAPG